MQLNPLDLEGDEQPVADKLGHDRSERPHLGRLVVVGAGVAVTVAALLGAPFPAGGDVGAAARRTGGR